MVKKIIRNHLLKALIFFVILFVLPIFLTNSFIKKESISQNKKIKLGAFGLPLVNLNVKHEKKPIIILIGNSVWQSTSVINKLIDIIYAHKKNWEIRNYSMSGTSIFDELYLYSLIQDQNPSLVVFQLNPCSFGCAMPIFRTSVKNYLFEKNNWNFLLNKTFFSSLSAEEIAFSFFCKIFPSLQYIDVIRIKLKKYLNEIFERLHFPRLMNFFPYQEIFPGLSESDLIKNQHLFLKDLNVYIHSRDTINFLLKLLENKGQKALFIGQENDLEENEISSNYKSIFSHKNFISFVDNRSYFEKEKFIDEFHPKEMFTKEVAQRLFNQIRSHLEEAYRP